MGNESLNAGLRVEFGKRFFSELKNFPKQDRMLIKSFIDYVKINGLKGLQGRNKPSDDIPKDTPNWLKKVKYAQQYHLWHYHIGIPKYDETNPFGDQTSEYILHYIKGDDFIRIVDFSSHPPFKLPDISYLN